MVFIKNKEKNNVLYIISGVIILTSLFFLKPWIQHTSVCLFWLITILGFIFLFLGLKNNKLRIGLLIFVISFFASYNFSYNFTTSSLVGDNRNYGMVARSLLSNRDITLDEFSERLEQNNFYGVVRDNSHYYNYFPLGPSIVLAPIYALVSINPVADPVTAETQAGRLATALFFGIALYLFFFLVSRFEEVDLPKALLFTFIFGFCSHQLSQHFSMFWSHNAVMPFIIGALLALKIEQRNMVFLAGTLLVLGYMMRPTVALLVPIVAIWLWLYQRKFFLYFIAGCFIAGVLVVSMNLTFYGHLISPYSQIDRLGSSSFFEALVGNLFSPNRGLFIFMPWAIFSIWGIWLSFRSKIDPFFKFISVFFLLHLILISSFPHWWAGYSYGPRLIVETMPMLVLLLLPVLSLSLLKNKIFKFLFIIAIFFSFFVQVSGLTSIAGDWNVTPRSVDQFPSRLWDWSDMQLLRPLNEFWIKII